MSPELRPSTSEQSAGLTSASSREPAPATQFVWEFNLQDIDPSLIFDESDSNPSASQDQQPELTQFENAPSYYEWLQFTQPLDEALPEATPSAFKWADAEAKKVKSRLATVNEGGLKTIGGALGSLMNMVGACGPLCAHALGSLGQVGSSGLSLTSPVTSGFNMPGFNVDNKGRFQMTGSLDTLSRATGLSREALLSGSFSVQDILSKFINVCGEGLCQIFGFGLVECLIDGILPSRLPTPAT